MGDQHAVLYSVGGEKFLIRPMDELANSNIRMIKSGALTREDLHIVGVGNTSSEAMMIQQELESEHGLKNNISSYL